MFKIMKKFVLMAAMAAGIIASACSNKTDATADSADIVDTNKLDTNVLVAYYSATGTTEKAAKEIADATGGTLYQIEPVKPYSDEDLDYENKDSRSSVENANPDMRPEIKLGLDLAQYETVYIGFPVWWDKAPLVVYTFLDAYNFQGKKIIIFATSHSSGLTPSFDALKKAYPSYDFTAGEILSVSTGDQFKEWVNSLGK